MKNNNNNTCLLSQGRKTCSLAAAIHPDNPVIVIHGRHCVRGVESELVAHQTSSHPKIEHERSLLCWDWQGIQQEIERATERA